jgi:leucyl-tRNA synthetase
MTQPYNPQALEEKWLQVWEDAQLFQNSHTSSAQDKLFLLFAFAYPSGSGLHVGHVESKTALDILARYHRMNGKDVFFPVGWDAFGLPAENYAIKTGIHPVETTKNAINTFRRQIKRLAISYDWANEIATCHPEYYRWTQWIFAQLYIKGLAYKKKGSVNWCPSCQTVLANEQVVNGACERCGTDVVQKDMVQWFFKITQYQDELISGLDEVDWPRPTKDQQLHWIGKSEGARVTFQAKGVEDSLTVFTTAHDTIFGCTFMVIAPEHAFLEKHRSSIKNWSEIEDYLKNAQKKTELQRQAQKEKTGVKVEGITFINPVNGVEIPLYVADYVLATYGTGAIMAVPGQDERDHEFAEKYNLEIIQVATSTKGDLHPSFISYADIKQDRQQYFLINSGRYDGMNYEEARAGILEELEAKQAGFAQNEYRLRDWLISRQRYWGVPIPVIYDPEGNPHLVDDSSLPWVLPTDVDFKPTGESPLTSSTEFQARTESYAATHHAELIAQKGWDTSGKGWRPEYDTMDTFVDSSWYFLRYVDSRNPDVFASPEQLKKWLPVDFYMIGPEHIVLHLLYSRFFTKFLRDEGYFSFGEPFLKMRHQGMILGPDHKKMSKSKGNVINPDEVIEKFGADTLRVYEMFMGPIESDKPWDTSAVNGVYRFLRRIYDLTTATAAANQPNSDATVHRKLHQTILKVTEDIPGLKFNTAIAAMMEFVNVWEKQSRELTAAALSVADLKLFVGILAPFAPFAAEELWAVINGYEVAKPTVAAVQTSIHTSTWPTYDAEAAKPEQVIIPVQVNGRVRAQLVIEHDQVEDQAAVLSKAKAEPRILEWLAKGKMLKEIYVPGKILSFVVAA